MGTAGKVWLIVGICLVLVGGLVFVGVMSALKWDFTKLSTVKYETNTYVIAETFDNLSFETDTADISFVPSEDGSCRVVCQEQANLKHSVTVQDGTLTISEQDTRKWYEYVGISLGSTKLTIFLPKTDYGALTIKESTGDITLSAGFFFESVDILASTGDVNCKSSALREMKIHLSTGDITLERVNAHLLDLKVTTGKIHATSITCATDLRVKVSTGDARLTDSSCKNLISEGDTGDLFLKNVIAAEKFSIERDTGDVKLDGCDAGELVVKTSTGDVTGSLLTSKIFIPASDTGKIQVPHTLTGGKCEITTSTGNIQIDVLAQ